MSRHGSELRYTRQESRTGGVSKEKPETCVSRPCRLFLSLLLVIGRGARARSQWKKPRPTGRRKGLTFKQTTTSPAQTAPLPASPFKTLEATIGESGQKGHLYAQAAYLISFRDITVTTLTSL
jgi:hypothetical protein